MTNPNHPLDDLLDLVPPALMAESGDLFHSGRSAFEQPAPLYLLGLNPGGNPTQQEGDTIAAAMAAARQENRRHWCSYSDQAWGRAPGTHPYQASVLHLYRKCELDPHKVPAANVIFVRTTSEADVAARKDELLDLCWPVHDKVITTLGVGVVACLGQSAGSWVRQQLGADTLIDQYTETNNRGWSSTTHQAADGIQVVTLTHPSRVNWVNPQADPTDLVRRALARAAAGHSGSRRDSHDRTLHSSQSPTPTSGAATRSADSASKRWDQRLMIAMENGTNMTCVDVLKFNPRWSHADQAIIAEELEITGAAEFTFRQSGYNTFVAVAAADGRPLMDISKGTIYFKGGYKPDRPGAELWNGSGPDYILRLSTHQAGGGVRQEKANGQVCSVCFQEMSLTGECGTCE